MNQAIQEMLDRYRVTTPEEAENALKEIIQEIALLGLHRGNFFEKAAFYGGTALRVLYSLPRYSEDLDFTLFKPDKSFSLTPYFSYLEKELTAYGFQARVETVNKKSKTNVESAFIKADTKIHLLKIEPFQHFEKHPSPGTKLQIKFEVDADPAVQFEYEPRYLLQPISFPVISLKQPDLFAGKVHALLYRKWKNRIKGRDFYDYVWYLKKRIPLRLHYLHEKAVQSGHIGPSDLQTLSQLKTTLYQRFDTIDFNAAKADILPFIKDPQELNLWSADFFKKITENIEITPS